MEKLYQIFIANFEIGLIWKWWHVLQKVGDTEKLPSSSLSRNDEEYDVE